MIKNKITKGNRSEPDHNNKLTLLYSIIYDAIRINEYAKLKFLIRRYSQTTMTIIDIPAFEI